MSATSDKKPGIIKPKTPVVDRPKSSLGRWINNAVHFFIFISFLIIIASGALFIRLKSGPLILPGAQAIVEDLAKDALSDFDVQIGDVSIVATQTGLFAQVQLTDLRIFTKSGMKIAAFPVVRAKIDPLQLVLSGVEVSSIEIIGAEFRILRDVNGKYNILPPGTENNEVIKPETIFAAANKAATKSPLSSLTLIDMIDTKFVYIDRLKSRVWRTSKALMQSTREGNIITANADVVMSTTDHADTSVGLRFSYGLGDDFFGFGLKFDQLATVDLADQIHALDWLRSIDAAVSGSVNAEIKVNGVLDRLSGVLQSDKGQLHDSPDTAPIQFNNLKTYFEYQKETDSLTFTQITAKSAIGSLTGEGAISLKRDGAGAVNALSGSIDLSKLLINPDGIFPKPLTIDRVSADIHISLSPFTLTLDRGELQAGSTHVSLVGSSVAEGGYWDSAYSLRFNEIDRETVMQFWPLALKVKTRTWIDENVLAGVAKNGIGQLQMRDGKPTVDLKFDIEQGKVRYLKTLPVLQGAVGRGHLTEETFTAELSQGYVIAANNDRIDVSNSVFHVPDLKQKPAIGEISIQAKGSLQAALNMLDEKPFEFLKKASLKPSVATGQVTAEGDLTVVLIKGAKPEDVQFQVKADITNLVSKHLVKKHIVTADKMTLTGTDQLIELAGEVKLDGLTTQTRWVMPIGKANKKQSELISDVILDDPSLRHFGVKFEHGTISGSTPARVYVILRPNQKPQYTMTSDMAGMGIKVNSLNWSKPEESKGKLVLKGTFGDIFTVDKLSLETTGLTASGAVLFNKDSSFKQADLTKLTVGKWLNAAVSIQSTGQNTTKIIVNSGTADLRKANFSKGGKAGSPMDISLDRLVLADGIVLTNVVAKLSNTQGLRGPYTARVNGGAKISGSIFPQKFGTAAEVNAVDAGSVLRSANLYSQAHDGNLRMVLIPSAKEGHYQGTFQIKRTRVKQDNVLGGLLNAISGIGLLQQLAGEGIVFETVSGQFNLQPSGVQIHDTSAVGISIGITLEGIYQSSSKKVDFEGVITPLYAVNGSLERVFGKLLGRQKGEGLFSFVYRVSGTSTNPKTFVNPLSVLAPGVVREVFRTRKPEVSKADVPENEITNPRVNRFPRATDR